MSNYAKKFNSIIKSGDLVKILNNSGKNVFFWYKPENGDVSPVVLPGPLFGMYLKVWDNKVINFSEDWHEILYDNKIFLANIRQLRKIKL